MENQAEDIGSTTHSIHPDPLVEHIILKVLGPSLSGRRYATKWLAALIRFDYLTILDVITLSPRDIEEMGFSIGSRNLWEIFLSFIHGRATEDDQNIYNTPEFFWFNMTHDRFRAHRLQILQSRDTFIPTSTRNRNSPALHSSSPTVSFGSTPIQRNVTERPHNVPRMSSLGAFTPTITSPSPSKSIQTINPIVKKQMKITDYPTFSGQQTDWKLFERKFIAIANSQNYLHVLNLNFSPTPE